MVVCILVIDILMAVYIYIYIYKEMYIMHMQCFFQCLFLSAFLEGFCQRFSMYVPNRCPLAFLCFSSAFPQATLGFFLDVSSFAYATGGSTYAYPYVYVCMCRRAWGQIMGKHVWGHMYGVLERFPIGFLGGFLLGS